MRRSLLLCLLPVALGCLGSGRPCPEGINLLPKYGRARKCLSQKRADEELIQLMVRQQGSRQKGAEELVKLGWLYLGRNQPAVAMRRFNQAWLLDSLNSYLDWGFGATLGALGKHQESLRYFRAATAQQPENDRLWRDAAVSCGNRWVETKQQAYLDTAVVYLRKAIRLNGTEGYADAELAKAYHFYPQPDSARKYLALADKINPAQVDERIRELIDKR